MKEVEECDCCDGKGVVTTLFADDWSPCMNCNGTGTLKNDTDIEKRPDQPDNYLADQGCPKEEEN